MSPTGPRDDGAPRGSPAEPGGGAGRAAGPGFTGSGLGRAGGRLAVVARAPGRVNLIGEHTDYNQGLALPVAIDLRTTVHFVPDGSGRLRLTTSVDRAPATVEVHPPPGPADVTAFRPRWARLVAALVMEGRPARGGTIRITSSVPAGSGLSSSAAVCVALALALGVATDPVATAELCRRAEAAAGSEVGLMDPLVSMAGKAGHGLLVDFSDLGWEAVPIPAGAELVVVHSGVDRVLSSTGYPARRAECAAAARELGVPLGRAGASEAAGIADPTLRRRARYVVAECARVRSFAAALRQGDVALAGEIMAESHRGQAQDYDVSTTVVDQLVQELSTTPGVHGARLTGGGFGGCVVALAEPGAVDPGRWPGRVTRVVPSDGASVEVEPGTGAQP